MLSTLTPDNSMNQWDPSALTPDNIVWTNGIRVH